MPTRAIAHALMQRESHVAPHDELFREVQHTGLMRSHRHFKHCLKMMRLQKRVLVQCTGLLRVGASQRTFVVKLTRRGHAVYRFYRDCEQWAAAKATTTTTTATTPSTPSTPTTPTTRGLRDAL
ncbi:unnamed protein product [Agarophyton chilense]